MQQTRTYSVTAPGFTGLNTQDAPVDLDSKFALEANNCVIDKFGRVGSRKGWTAASDSNADLSTNNIEAIGELIDNTGVRTTFACGNGFLFKLGGTTLTKLTYGGPGAAPTITTNNWQCVTLNAQILFFQEGYDPLVYDPTVSTTQFRRVSELTGASGTVPKANCAIAAYGRIWAARTDTDKITLSWTDTLTTHKWTAGTAGSLNLYGVWPQGGDEIMGLAAHNNALIIFGVKQILVYTGASTPSTMALSDAVGNCGCVGRDTIQNSPDDVIFLSDGGVRSLARTIQEKSAPLTVLSRSVNNDIQNYIVNEASSTTIKAVYSPIDSFYLLTFKTSQITYCFDMRTPMQDGSRRVTTWTGNVPKCYFYSPTRNLYMGQAGYIGKYAGYYDNGVQYRMSYYTTWIDFGDPIRTSILKRIGMTLLGAGNQPVVYKWGFDYITGTRSQLTQITGSTNVAEYNIAEYNIAEYTQNQVIKDLNIPATGVGKVVQIGVECNIIGSAISIQRIDIFTKDGAYK